MRNCSDSGVSVLLPVFTIINQLNNETLFKVSAVIRVSTTCWFSILVQSFISHHAYISTIEWWVLWMNTHRFHHGIYTYDLTCVFNVCNLLSNQFKKMLRTWVFGDSNNILRQVWSKFIEIIINVVLTWFKKKKIALETFRNQYIEVILLYTESVTIVLYCTSLMWIYSYWLYTCIMLKKVTSCDILL